jgi:hypothetical protein
VEHPIFHRVKHIQATREIIADEQASMVKLEQEHERLMSHYEKHHQEIMGNCETERLLMTKEEDHNTE